MLPALISAGANIVGGFLGKQSAEKNAERNIKLQKDFAQQGIRWKVADAKAAGIHPLAALGAQTTSFSPISVGNPLGEGLASAGQDISRAVNATRTAPERADAYTKTVQDLNVRRMGLENELLASQIAKINQAGIPPAMPSEAARHMLEGQGNSPLVENTPLSRVTPSPGAGSQEPGSIVETGFSRTPSGFAPVMSKDVKERLEEDFIGSMLWNVRNRLSPTIGGPDSYHPPATNPEGTYWIYSPSRQEYQLRNMSDRPRYGFRKWYQ